jgi:hypothetical protein
MKLLLVTWAILFSLPALCFIPRGMLILEKTVDNSGKGTYQIELEVQFPNGQENLNLKELWTVDSENNFRLVVTGTKDLRDKILLSETINGGTKLTASGSSRINTEYLERYFHFRSVENLAQNLIQLKIAPQSLMTPKAIQVKKPGDFQPENFVRLARSGGVINYAFGAVSTDADGPGIWIEQDQFLIRKLRLPNNVELVAEKYAQYGRGLQYPRARTLRWNSNTVQIQTLGVAAKNKETLKTLKPENNFSLLAGQPAEALIQEFYQRFR